MVQASVKDSEWLIQGITSSAHAAQHGRKAALRASLREIMMHLANQGHPMSLGKMLAQCECSRNGAQSGTDDDNVCHRDPFK